MRARGLPDSSATLPEADFLFSELSGYLKPEDVSELQNAYLLCKFFTPVTVISLDFLYAVSSTLYWE